MHTPMNRGTDARKLKADAAEAAAKGKHKKALEKYLELERIEPKEGGWARRAGEMYRQLGRVDEGIAAFQRAAEKYAASGLVAKASAVCQAILRLRPQDAGARATLDRLTSGGAPSPTPGARGAVPMRLPTSDGLSGRHRAASEPGAFRVRAGGSVPPPAAPPPAAPPQLDPARTSEVDSLGPEVRPERTRASTPPPTPPTTAPPARLEPREIASQGLDVDEPRSLAIEEPEALEIEEIEELDADLLDDAGDEIELVDEAAAAGQGEALLDRDAMSAGAPAESQGLFDLAASEPAGRPGDAGLVDLPEPGMFDHVADEAAASTGAPPRPEAAAGRRSEPELEIEAVAVDDPEDLDLGEDLAGFAFDEDSAALDAQSSVDPDELYQEVLASSPLFAPFAPEEARSLVERFDIVEIEAGETVVEAGRLAERLILLARGKLVIAGQDGESAAPAGTVLGTTSLLSRAPEPATARAVSACVALALPSATFRELIMTHPMLLAQLAEA
jgi:tetratricopeptide (TPR) repeat protein